MNKVHEAVQHEIKCQIQENIRELARINPPGSQKTKVQINGRGKWMDGFVVKSQHSLDGADL